MTSLSYPQRLATVIEYAEIHTAVCRYRKQGLVCSTCSDTAERAARARAALARQTEQAA